MKQDGYQIINEISKAKKIAWAIQQRPEGKFIYKIIKKAKKG